MTSPGVSNMMRGSGCRIRFWTSDIGAPESCNARRIGMTLELQPFLTTQAQALNEMTESIRYEAGRGNSLIHINRYLHCSVLLECLLHSKC